MPSTSLSPAETEIVEIATDALIAAGLKFVLIVSGGSRGGDIFSNLTLPDTASVLAQVAAVQDLPSLQVKPH